MTMKFANIFTSIRRRLNFDKREREMKNSEVREMVHNIINFTTDSIGRELANSCTQEWSQANNVDMLTQEQAKVILQNVETLIKNSAFTVLSQS